MLRFIRAYVKTMRLYYAFLTGIAGWIGVSYYEFIARAGSGALPGTAKKVVVLVFLFCVWGINQVINDYLGLAEDRINAPHRPMVTGELHAGAALGLSAALVALVGVVTWLWLEPVALLPMLAGVGLNVVYEYAKGHGIWGNLVFGVMIACCTVYGFLACGPWAAPLLTLPRVGVVALVALLNSTMTYFTYFKDYEGDRQAGKVTLVVRYGPQRARVLGVALSAAPALGFAALWGLGALPVPLPPVFRLLAVLALFLQGYTALLYYRHPVGERTYRSLKFNFRACICAQATLIALYDGGLGMALFLVSYIFVGLLFDLAGDSQA